MDWGEQEGGVFHHNLLYALLCLSSSLQTSLLLDQETLHSIEEC